MLTKTLNMRAKQAFLVFAKIKQVEDVERSMVVDITGLEDSGEDLVSKLRGENL